MNILFAGFRHGHIMGLYDMAMENPNVNIVGCYEGDIPNSIVADNTEINFNYTSYEEALKNDEIDAVAIGDYYGIRGKMVIAALKAGKHVICDKPICTDLKELKEIEKLVKKTGLKVSCMLDLRYMPQADKVKKMIADGVIGEVKNVSFTGQHCLDYGNRPHWYYEAGKHGGTINDIAIHGVDLIRYITGKNLTKVHCARTWNSFAKEEPDFKDCGQFMADMEGMALMADVSYAAPKFEGTMPTYWEFCFWGTEGMIKFHLASNRIHLYKTNEEIIECAPTTIEHMRDFIRETNGEATVLDTDDILKSQRQVLTIQKASK